MMLIREGGQFLLMADGYRLMTSSLNVSEADLAREAFARVDDCRRVLIGGLGMGFTLRSALDALPAHAEVVVGELVEEVVEWNKTFLGKLAHHPVRDPRTSVFLGDVAKKLDGTEQWDAILLDVDNGATAFTREQNETLYGDEGIERIKKSLSPGGILAVWSTGPNRKFERRLKRAGFRYESIRVVENQGSAKNYHFLFLAWVNSNSSVTATELSLV